MSFPILSSDGEIVREVGQVGMKGRNLEATVMTEAMMIFRTTMTLLAPKILVKNWHNALMFSVSTW
jgi:hypothetical protein